MVLFIKEYWYILVVLAVCCGVVGYNINVFIQLPTSKKKEKIIKWLIWAVTQAEIKYGSKTGKLKLSEVYSMFISTFPAIANMISFDTFSSWVDEALEEMNHLINTNKAVAELVTKEEPKVNTTTEEVK